MNTARSHCGTALSDVATPTQTLQAISRGIAAAQQTGTPRWKGATEALIQLCVDLRLCFSSGELSAWMRTYRPDLRFSAARDVGPHVRSLHAAGRMPDYATGPVVRATRHTGGFSHTPVGTTVYVYGPNARSAEKHRFEVEIPRPGAPIPHPAALPPLPVQHATPLKGRTARRARPAQAPPKTWQDTDTARVHVDGRLCIPRRAFRTLAERLQVTLSGGDAVYVREDGDEVLISAVPLQGARRHHLVTSRGRLLFTARTGSPFPPSTRYAVQVTDKGLTLDRACPV